MLALPENQHIPIHQEIPGLESVEQYNISGMLGVAETVFYELDNGYHKQSQANQEIEIPIIDTFADAPRLRLVESIGYVASKPLSRRELARQSA